MMSFGLAYDANMCHNDVMDITALRRDARGAPGGSGGRRGRRHQASRVALADALEPASARIMARSPSSRSRSRRRSTTESSRYASTAAEIRIAVSAAPDAEEDTDADECRSSGERRVEPRDAPPSRGAQDPGRARRPPREGLSLNTWLAWAVRDALRAVDGEGARIGLANALPRSRLGRGLTKRYRGTANRRQNDRNARNRV